MSRRQRIRISWRGSKVVVIGACFVDLLRTLATLDATFPCRGGSGTYLLTDVGVSVSPSFLLKSRRELRMDARSVPVPI